MNKCEICKAPAPEGEPTCGQYTCKMKLKHQQGSAAQPEPKAPDVVDLVIADLQAGEVLKPGDRLWDSYQHVLQAAISLRMEIGKRDG